ncbi:hypothetical protein [Acidicapsa ligni]|uniref:hypothetical protein n=1 Tax=Acidicapsa ligni TaxID=542300 RepID=UPI0021DFBCAD|nr:hypothetical protein [Acidicapsa ligni]
MPPQNLKVSPILLPAILLAGILGSLAPIRVSAETPSQTHVSPVTDKDIAYNQAELIRLLSLSPTLTTVVARDPSLLANQDYVTHNNPQLGEFLANHPEITRNPDFYLFTHLKDNDGQPEQALERAVWPQMNQPPHERRLIESLIDEIGPFFVFIGVAGALMWLIRQILQNRRWSRIFKLQMDVHNKLIDKFSDSQDLLVYMGTDAGKRFLEAAPLPVDFEQDQRVSGAVSRILNPLQIGIVLSLLGVGILFVRNAHVELRIPLMVLGTIVLMPGLGFIISAGVTWLLASRLGLFSDSKAPAIRNGFPSSDPRDHQ